MAGTRSVLFNSLHRKSPSRFFTESLTSESPLSWFSKESQVERNRNVCEKNLILNLIKRRDCFCLFSLTTLSSSVSCLVLPEVFAVSKLEHPVRTFWTIFKCRKSLIAGNFDRQTHCWLLTSGYLYNLPMVIFADAYTDGHLPERWTLSEWPVIDFNRDRLRICKVTAANALKFVLSFTNFFKPF